MLQNKMNLTQWLIDKTDWILGIITNSLRKNKHTSYPQSDESDWSASLTHDLLSPTNFWNGSLWKCGNLSQAWRFYFVFVFPHCTVQYQGAVVLMNPKCHSPVESCYGDKFYIFSSSPSCMQHRFSIWHIPCIVMHVPWQSLSVVHRFQFIWGWSWSSSTKYVCTTMHLNIQMPQTRLLFLHTSFPLQLPFNILTEIDRCLLPAAAAAIDVC